VETKRPKVQYKNDEIVTFKFEQEMNPKRLSLFDVVVVVVVVVVFVVAVVALHFVVGVVNHC
jgi:hypothetical protein